MSGKQNANLNPYAVLPPSDDVVDGSLPLGDTVPDSDAAPDRHQRLIKFCIFSFIGMSFVVSFLVTIIPWWWRMFFRW